MKPLLLFPRRLAATLLYAVALAALLCAAAVTAAPPSKRVPVLVIGSKVYHRVIVERLGPFSARLSHEGGICTIDSWELAEKDQRTFGFNPSETSAERARRARETASETARQIRDERLQRQAIAEAVARREAARLAAEESDRLAIAEQRRKDEERQRIAIEKDRKVAELTGRIAAIDQQIADLKRRGYKRMQLHAPPLLLQSRGGQLQAALAASYNHSHDNRPMSMSQFMNLSPEAQSAVVTAGTHVLGLDPMADLQYERTQLARQFTALGEPVPKPAAAPLKKPAEPLH